MPPVLTKNTDFLKQEVNKHITADAVVQGSYWEDGKGCFIGCLAHSSDPSPLAYLYGLPLPIVRLAESIFESLPIEEAKQFFADFPDAVQCDGKDLSLVHWAFIAETLRHLPPQHPEIQAAIDQVISGMELLASGGVWEKDAARAAAKAAWNASLSSGDEDGAAWVAKRAIDAYFQVTSVSVIWAAWAAREVAGRAAVDAAWVAEAAELLRQRDSLLRLIREAPVATPSLV